MKKLLLAIMLIPSIGYASLINVTTNPAKKVSDYVAQIQSNSTSMYKGILDIHTATYNLIWNNPDYPPQTIISGFAPADQTALFQYSGAVQQVLSQANPKYVVLSPNYTITPNADGSVNLCSPICASGQSCIQTTSGNLGTCGASVGIPNIVN